MTGIATKLKAAGYATHQVGKWHAGGATPDHIPTGRGFNTSFGYLNVYNDYYTEVDATGVNGTGPDNYMKMHSLQSVLCKCSKIMIPTRHYFSTMPLTLPMLRYRSLIGMQKFSFIDDSRRQYVHTMIDYLDEVVGNLTKLMLSKSVTFGIIYFLSLVVTMVDH